MYAITGASGNTGRVIAEKLLERGEKVRVIGRDAKRLARFVQKGAEAFVADVTDAAALARAFDGARAVYLMVPPNITSTGPRAYQEQVSDALASAVEKASVQHVVVLSSIGADKPEKTGPVVGLHNLEQKLNRIAGLSALYFRAGYFMENLLPQTEVIKNFGIVGGPVRADLPLIECLDKSEDPALRLLAVRALGELGGVRAVFALNKVKNDGDPAVRTAARMALNDLGELD